MFNEDYIYIFFLIPSAISCAASLSVITTAVIKSGFKQFNRITVLIALFSLLQCISIFLGPRYEHNSILCSVQEYMIQFGYLSQAFASTILCFSIHLTIKYKANLEMSTKLGIVVLLFIICMSISIGNNTSKLFCSFYDTNDVISLSRNSKEYSASISYIISIFLPILLCMIINLYLTIDSFIYANHIGVMDAVSTVSKQLLIYPLFMASIMIPLTLFFVIVIATGHYNHTLGKIGALLASCSGLVNAYIYFAVMHNNKININDSQFRSTYAFSSIIYSSQSGPKPSDLSESLVLSESRKSHPLGTIPESVNDTTSTNNVSYYMEF
jgi:hypothetical protein